MITYPIEFPRRRKHARPRATAPPIIPIPANVILVTGSFGDVQTIWHFDQPIVILPGATFEMFTLREDGGPEQTIGVSGVLLDPLTLRVTMNVAPQDFGNGWFWELLSVPPMVKTLDGAAVHPGGGDLTLG
jgi:hypothetical protein